MTFKHDAIVRAWLDGKTIQAKCSVKDRWTRNKYAN